MSALYLDGLEALLAGDSSESDLAHAEQMVYRQAPALIARVRELESEAKEADEDSAELERTVTWTRGKLADAEKRIWDLEAVLRGVARPLQTSCWCPRLPSTFSWLTDGHTAACLAARAALGIEEDR